MYAAILPTQKQEVDRAIAMCFYANGIPFNVARSRYWKRAVKKISSYGAGYIPPGYDRLRTDLLDTVRRYRLIDTHP